MNKKILLNLIAITLLSLTLQAKDSFNTIFRKGKVSGEIRSFSIARSLEFSNPAFRNFTRKANAIGGYLKYETAPLYGFNLATALYTTNGFALKSNKVANSEVDPTILGKNNESYSILGEAYIGYLYNNTSFKLGRQKINTPLAGSDDGRMLPNLFQAYTLMNKDLANTTIFISHATHFAQGTFGRIYSSESGASRDKILAATSAYSAIDDRNQVGRFLNIGTYALGTKTDGLSIFSTIYTGIDNLKLQVWDYYAHDIMNAIYLQADYKWNYLLNAKVKPFAAIQYIKENDVGDKLLKNMGGDGELNSDYLAVKLGLNIDNFSSYIAYSTVSENGSADSTYANATITMWGGMPAFIQGMLTRLAGTRSSKIYTSYNWKILGVNLQTSASYAKFDMAKYNGWTNGDADEVDFSATYYPSFVKNISLKIRATHANDFLVFALNTGTLSWDEYHFVVKYNF